MQAKKRYILVFVSCAFLAYCYFGGYRLKRKTILPPSVTRTQHNHHISIPVHLPSFLSHSECNGVDEIVAIDSDSIIAIDKIAPSAYHHSYASKLKNNEELARHGSQLPSSSTSQNRPNGMYTHTHTHTRFFILPMSTVWNSSQSQQIGCVLQEKCCSYISKQWCGSNYPNLIYLLIEIAFIFLQAKQ